MVERKISELTESNNPRTITKEDLESLKRSIQDFRKMLKIRPVVIDETGRILGGHQKVKAAKELGWETIPTYTAKGWTEEMKREFIYRDNIHAGDWDWKLLENWDADLLAEYNLEVPEVDIKPMQIEFDDDIESAAGEMTQAVVRGIRIETEGEDQYNKLIEALKDATATEQITKALVQYGKSFN